jgi:hypothetical protein
MHEPGDILLFTLSAWKETGWTAFKRAFDEAYRIRRKTEQVNDPDPIHFERARALRTLVACGHCDVDFSVSPLITIGPPVLASLPYSGLPRAVLCGSRAPNTVKLLQHACDESRSSRVLLDSQRKRAPYAPMRVEVEAESYAALDGIAKSLNIAFVRTPQSWVLSTVSGSLSEYIGQLEWSAQNELNWEREDFDPEYFRFTPVQRGANKATDVVRLSRYLNPTRLQWEHRLVGDTGSAAVNPDWGRYAILNARRKNSLLYENRRGTLAVARGTPLPILLARSLVLCSGFVPKKVSARLVHSSLPEHYGFDFYDGVPQDVLTVVMQKLGQQHPLEQLAIHDEAR